MILDDGTDTDKVMMRAINTYGDERIDKLSIYAQNNNPKTSVEALLAFWNGPKGNDQWTYSLVDPESAIQEVLSICAGK